MELEKEKAEGKNRDMVLITEWGKYRMGIHFSGEPYAIFATDKDKIESPEEMEPSGIWIEKDIYKKDNKVVYVIDMEKSIESLVIFP